MSSKVGRKKSPKVRTEKAEPVSAALRDLRSEPPPSRKPSGTKASTPVRPGAVPPKKPEKKLNVKPNRPVLRDLKEEKLVESSRSPGGPDSSRLVASIREAASVHDTKAAPPPPPSVSAEDVAAVTSRSGSVPSSAAAAKTAPSVPPAPVTKQELEEEIRVFEREIDESLRRNQSSRRMDPDDAPPSMPELFDTARELLSSDYYLRQWGRLGMRNRSEEVDDFGFDPVYEEKVRPLFDALYTKYFRVETIGIENVPDEGRCLLVANHSGTLPIDGVMIKTAIKREQRRGRDLRWLTEDTVFHFPFLGSISNRIGAVRACQENAERLLRHDSLVAVFPEGGKGIGKLFRDRYKLQRFGRGGYIKLCLRTGTPIVPVAVIGGEETQPLFAKIEAFSKVFGIPYFPITPTFPLLGPVGLLPLPSKWKLIFGEPLRLDEYGPLAAEDEVLVNRLSERVRSSIQAMVDTAIGERKSVWFG